jgi:hypothetical protein
MRIGGTKAGKSAPVPSLGPKVLQHIAENDGEVKPLEQQVRAQAEAAVTATLERIRAIQTDSLDRNGKIKRAKFKAAVLALRWEGFGPRESAEILGTTQGTVEKALMSLRKDASLDDQIKRVDQLIVPLAVDNMARGVMAGDKEYTLRVLDGRGVLRAFKSVDAHVTRKDLKLHVLVTMPEHHKDSIPTVKANGVFGVPKGDAGALTEKKELTEGTAAGTRALAPPAAARIVSTPETI